MTQIPSFYFRESVSSALSASEQFYMESRVLPYPKNEISTPAATAEPMTPEILLDIQ